MSSLSRANNTLLSGITYSDFNCMCCKIETQKLLPLPKLLDHGIEKFNSGFILAGVFVYYAWIAGLII